MTAWQKWFVPRRDWNGRHAMVPVETCYRILELCSWSFAVLGTVMLVWLAVYGGARVLAWVYWVAVGIVLLQWIGAILRGLPFVARYALFSVGLTVFLLLTSCSIGVTPNWSVLLVFMFAATGLLFGLRAGFGTATLVVAAHLPIAWGWITGRLPAAVLGPVQANMALAYLDFHSLAVWLRVLTITTGLLVVLLLFMRYVLRDTSDALHRANTALQNLTLEQDLRTRTERKFAAIFNDSPDICGITRFSDGRIIDVNRGFEQLSGWRREDVVGRTTLEIGFWDNAAEREKVMQLLRDNGALVGHETHWHKCDGERRVGLFSMRRMELGGEQVLNFVIRDITERRRREHALQSFIDLTGGVTGQEFFAATARHLATELGLRYAYISELVTNPDGTLAARTLGAWKDGPAPDFTYALAGSPCENVVGHGLCHHPDRVAELFPRDLGLPQIGARSYVGLPIHDHLGKALGLVVVLDDKPMPDAEAASLLLVLVASRAAAELQRLRHEREIEGLNAELETRVRQRTAELAARVAEVERLNTEQQALMRDLRESQQSADRAAARLQEANSNLLAANQELEAFSYSVSHDLRAPLRNMTGFLELLGRRTQGKLDAEAGRFIAIVNNESARMGMLIDDLLTFSHVGRAEMRLQTVALDRLAATVRDELQADIGSRTVEWQIGPLPAVRGDPDLLHQVFANLFANAVKFTRPRSVAHIEVGAAPPARGEHSATIFVRDNGAGFNPRYLDKLFGVFQRLHNSRDFEGTGIGLANVKRIITRHGGRVWAEGQVDRGATFYFTLTLAE